MTAFSSSLTVGAGSIFPVCTAGKRQNVIAVTETRFWQRTAFRVRMSLVGRRGARLSENHLAPRQGR
jgi:hypothetical protein